MPPKKATKTASKKSAAAKSLTKSQFIAEIAKDSEQTNSLIKRVMESFERVIEGELKAERTVSVNGLFKIKIKHKPKTEKRMGTNPQTGEPMEFKAKPAKKVVRISALKKLKEMVL
jgi:DNA-binding protein HU-beta